MGTTCFDRVGGATGVRRTVDELYLLVMADDELAPLFDGADLDRVREHMTALLAMVLDGPERYAGRDLADVHAPLRITPRQFQRFGDHLYAALTVVPVDEEVLISTGLLLMSVEAQVVDPVDPAEPA